MTQNDFRILNVAQCDLLIAEKEVERENVIQITFASMAILWDLDQHKEVTFISKQSHFANQNDYTPTGFILH